MEETKQPAPKQSSKDVEENKAIAAIGYLGILCFVPLLAKKESKFAQFHAKQGLVLFIVEVIGVFLHIIPILGWIVAWMLFIACAVASIMGIVNAINGEEKDIPGVAELAKKFNI